MPRRVLVDASFASFAPSGLKAEDVPSQSEIRTERLSHSTWLPGRAKLSDPRRVIRLLPPSTRLTKYKDHMNLMIPRLVNPQTLT
ncbi:hypothetical protein SCLCIDRAFT_674821 [Scleroderma citrinum Foug A]|uniref:Uncharacterized protein n=1 Tax=Scleroderma citrinum Foug A TaxID=1036808 RepID=A0A0C3AG91_9AGAM|nr:hypothetical protein SCLCIDRAFT_674821 [Scleroderma citrinum Foug A]